MISRRWWLLVCAAMLVGITTAGLRGDDAEEGWITIFDGQSMDGWKASENTDSWQLVDGALVCHGPRSHLFYMGADRPFKNFELQADVMTTPGSNAGIYFHTKYQETGWPKYGHECQVNISHSDPIKTGSIYGVVPVTDPPAKDNEYWTQHIIVRGQHIVVKVNGKTVVDYEEPKDKPAFSEEFERRLGQGTFALQAHDPDSKVSFKNIRVKRLPD